ncbi:hypothetical protein P7C70_g4155, partial [Phenoliferia sp. Uapishka_3]
MHSSANSTRGAEPLPCALDVLASANTPLAPTFSYTSPIHPLLLPEIISTIFQLVIPDQDDDEHWQSRSDVLRSCALVCSTWRAPAQEELFRNTIVAPSLSSHMGGSVLRKMEELTETLDHEPILAGHIRRLEVNFGTPRWTKLSPEHSSQLEKLFAILQLENKIEKVSARNIRSIEDAVTVMSLGAELVEFVDCDFPTSADGATPVVPQFRCQQLAFIVCTFLSWPFPASLFSSLKVLCINFVMSDGLATMCHFLSVVAPHLSSLSIHFGRGYRPDDGSSLFYSMKHLRILDDPTLLAQNEAVIRTTIAELPERLYTLVYRWKYMEGTDEMTGRKLQELIELELAEKIFVVYREDTMPLDLQFLVRMNGRTGHIIRTRRIVPDGQNAGIGIRWSEGFMRLTEEVLREEGNAVLE